MINCCYRFAVSKLEYERNLIDPADASGSFAEISSGHAVTLESSSFWRRAWIPRIPVT
jgi:hypothetical protein